jgi:hypothetical protein
MKKHRAGNKSHSRLSKKTARHVPLARTQAKLIDAHDNQFKDEMSAFSAQVFDAIDHTGGSPLAIARALHEPTPVVIAALNHLEHTRRVTAKDVGAQRSWAKTRG